MLVQQNLHLISDSTGETIHFIAKAVLSQFPNIQFKEHCHFLIRTEQAIERVLEKVKKEGGIVMYTMLHEEIEKKIIQACEEGGILYISPLDTITATFAKHLNVSNVKKVGKQHEISDEYYARMESINYTLAHDDGNLMEDLHDADIIILGVSRSSKSPTSIYLSYKGYKVANIPFIKTDLMPEYIKHLKKPLIVGFTIDASRLQNIRHTRIKSLEAKEDTSYTDIEAIKAEVQEAKKFFANLDIPVINVTQRSIEETAVYVINLLEEHKSK